MPKKSTISKLDKIVSQSPEESNPLAVNPNRQLEIIAACDKAGLTLDHLVKTIYDGTVAVKVIYDKLGNYVGEEPDTVARIKSASLGFDLRGETNSKANINMQTTMIAVIETLSTTAKTRLDEWKKNNVVDAK